MLLRTIALASLMITGASAQTKRAPLPPISDAILQEHVELGEELESRADGDLDGDGDPDTAYLIASEDRRTVHVLLRIHGGGVQTHRPAGELILPETPLGPASLSIANGVLKVEDLSGGTTAMSTTYRYRFDQKTGQMRLIGLDATLYSRTFAHDGYEMSWNLLTSAIITRVLALNEGGGDAAYTPKFEQRSRRPSLPIAMKDTPDPEMIMVDLRRK